MTISTEPTRLSYNGDDSTTAFAITWRYFEKSHIVATLRSSAGVETVQVLDTDYTLTAPAATGTLTMTTAPATGETLVIELDVPNTQTSSLPLAGALPSTAIEDELDKAALRDAQLQLLLNRCLIVPTSDTQTGSSLQIPIEDDRKGLYLAFDATTGAPIAGANVATSVASASTSATNASASATAAASSASDASSSASNAAVSETNAAADANTAANAVAQLGGSVSTVLSPSSVIITSDTTPSDIGLNILSNLKAATYEVMVHMVVDYGGGNIKIDLSQTNMSAARFVYMFTDDAGNSDITSGGFGAVSSSGMTDTNGAVHIRGVVNVLNTSATFNVLVSQATSSATPLVVALGSGTLGSGTSVVFRPI